MCICSFLREFSLANSAQNGGGGPQGRNASQGNFSAGTFMKTGGLIPRRHNTICVKILSNITMNLNSQVSNRVDNLGCE